MHGQGGAIVQLTQDKKEYILHDIIKEYAMLTWRTLLVAYVDYDIAEWERMSAENNGFKTVGDKANVEKDLVFAGLFGMKDPLRDKVPEAVRDC